MSRLVSVVVPVFNGMPHLRELTDSLLAQTYENLEIVFSDGGSSDDSAAYLAGLTDIRVRLIGPPSGTGAGANWTAVSEAAQGDFVKLVCQDDLLAPDAISRQVTDLDANPGAVMAVGQRDIIDANGALVYSRRGGAGLPSGLVKGTTVIRTCYLRGTNVIGEPLAVLFRREPFLDSLPWDDTNPLALDLMFYEKVAQLGDVVVRKEKVGAFRVSTSSWSTRLASVQFAQFALWQGEHVRSMTHPPSLLDRTRARTGLHLQTMLRRGAYTWLSLKGSFHTEH